MRACPKVLAAVAAALAALPALTIVNLACGTGSTLRALAPHLPALQNWKLVDNDLDPLVRAADAFHSRARSDNHANRSCAISKRHSIVPLIWVTSSGLLDLVSESWLERLVTDVAARRLPFYRALTSDGRITFEPSNPLDAAISRPLATITVATRNLDPIRPGCRNTTRTIATFEALRYFVVKAAADWVMKPYDRDSWRP